MFEMTLKNVLFCIDKNPSVVIPNMKLYSPPFPHFTASVWYLFGTQQRPVIELEIWKKLETKGVN